MEQVPAIQNEKLNSFLKKLPENYKQANLIFAYYAAFPGVFSPDMLNQLWLHFQTYKVGEEFKNMPYVVISDLLQSDLCEEVAFELFEFDPVVAVYLKDQMEKLCNRYKCKSLYFQKDLAGLTMAYAERVYKHSIWQNLYEIYYWKSIFVLKPEKANSKIKQILKEGNYEKFETWESHVRIFSALTELQNQKNKKDSFEKLPVFSWKAMDDYISIIKPELKKLIREKVDLGEFEDKRISKDSGKINRESTVGDVTDSSEVHDLDIRGNKEPKDKKTYSQKIKKLYVLMVGIQKYQYYPNLYGTISDVQKMYKFFNSIDFNDLEVANITTLLDGEATRENIIKSFREELILQAQDGDGILFYFSGLGAQEDAHDVFKFYESDNRLEGIVCYDSGPAKKGGNPLLVDKEFRYLMQELKGRNIDATMIYDCCHSGDITRYDGMDGMPGKDILVKRAGTPRMSRTWDEFIFAEKWQTDKEFYEQSIDDLLPAIPHVHLAACSSNEYAWEHPKGYGFFTEYLLQTLEATNGRVSYKELLRRIRQILRSEGISQNPQVYAPEEFGREADKIFLGNRIIDLPLKGNIKKKKGSGKWIMDLGAMAGVMIGQELTMRLDATNSVMMVVTKVFSEECEVEFLNEEGISDLMLDTSRVYQGEVSGLLQEKVSLFVPNSLKDLKNAFAFYKGEIENWSIKLVEEQSEAEFCAAIEEDQYYMYYGNDAEKRPILQYISLEAKDPELLFIKDIAHIGRWKAIKAIQNNQPTYLLPSDLEMHIEPMRGNATEKTLTNYDSVFTDVHLDTSEGAAYKCTVYNHSDQPLHVACLLLGSEFGVNPNIFRPNVVQIEANGSARILAGANLKTYFADYIKKYNWKEESVYLKLIASTQPMFVDYYKLDPLPMPGEVRKGPSRGILPEAIDHLDWISQTFEIRLLNPYYEK